MSWEIAGEKMQTLEDWKETPVVLIKIIQELAYGILKDTKEEIRQQLFDTLHIE